MVDRIRALCKTRNMSLASLEKELGFANGSLAKTDEKTQSGRILAIAQFFGVPMEYIMTGKIGDALTNEEKEMLSKFRSLNDSGRNLTLAQLSLTAGSDIYTSKKSSFSEVG